MMLTWLLVVREEWELRNKRKRNWIDVDYSIKFELYAENFNKEIKILIYSIKKIKKEEYLSQN